MRKPKSPPNFQDIFNSHAKDMGKAFADPQISSFLSEYEPRYFPWDKLRFAARGKGIDPEFAWLFIKLSRLPRYRALSLLGAEKTPLKLSLPDPLQHELMLIDQQLAGGLTSERDAAPTISQKERFIIHALREEAIASSMIEGAVTTRHEAHQMLKTGRKPRSHGEQMVLNNYRAIEFVREHRHTNLNEAFLLELQNILTEDTLERPDEGGRFRNENDNIRVVDVRDEEVMHIPPPASELPARLKALCSFANKPPQENNFIHPVIAACVLHFQLAFDHPYCDGNGRTARALFYWMMLRRGYWLFEYLPISRFIYRSPSKYVKAFLYCETDDFDVTYFLMYKARIIRQARIELRNYIAHKQAEMAQARSLFSSDRRLNHRQQQLVLHAARNQFHVFTIAEHQNKHAIAYGTARRDLLELVKWKYLKTTQVGNRFDFVADRRIEKIEDKIING